MPQAQTMKKMLLFFGFFVFISCISFSQEIPKVIDNKIYFLDNKTQIQIGDRDMYHIFSKQNRLVYISQQQKPNYGEYQIVFFDFWGEKIA